MLACYPEPLCAVVVDRLLHLASNTATYSTCADMRSALRQVNSNLQEAGLPMPRQTLACSLVDAKVGRRMEHVDEVQRSVA